jgi:hypothetical protein
LLCQATFALGEKFGIRSCAAAPKTDAATINPHNKGCTLGILIRRIRNVDLS